MAGTEWFAILRQCGYVTMLKSISPDWDAMRVKNCHYMIMLRCRNMSRDAFHRKYHGAHVWSEADSKGVSERDSDGAVRKMVCALDEGADQ